jgi:MFS family permease
MTTSVSQFWFGLYGDRFPSRWLLWAGPLAAVVCLGGIGLTQSPLVLAMLLTVAGLGIAAFHPEAAALAGSCAPEHRSRAMSIFTMGGFLGQATGPIYSGNLVDARPGGHDVDDPQRLLLAALPRPGAWSTQRVGMRRVGVPCMFSCGPRPH